jgi:UDP-N-acetylmuramoyl-L-alanyl-D-glutamate--2,6-diaminopimelate ligase
VLLRLKQLGRKILGERVIHTARVTRGHFAAWWYRYPAKDLRVIGVTGTNGKTTTATMIAKILSDAGFKVGLLTTVQIRIGDRVLPNTTKMTNPPASMIQKLLQKMAKERCDYVVLEVTSHALHQERVFGVPFYGTVFTNLTHDHLDYHKNFQGYREAKLRLFRNNPTVSVINRDDTSWEYFAGSPALHTFTYGLSPRADVRAIRARAGVDGSTFTAVYQGQTQPLTLAVPGKFNISNALAAVSLGLGIGLHLSQIAESLSTFSGVPGRMEIIDSGQKFRVFVDYAHSPDAFQRIYETIVPSVKGRIIHVFGATGDRDKTKRPILGAIAAAHADFCIVTDEDPYTENPKTIIDQVAKGIVQAGRGSNRKKEGVDFWRILDRRVAIRKAFSLARSGDVVLLTGKGAEEVMVVGDKKVPWDDRKVAREELHGHTS